MSSSRSSVELLFTPPRLSDPDVLHSEALELPPDSPSRRASSSVLTSLTPLSKSPQYSERLLYVEVPTLSSEVKAQYATDLAERALSVAEFFPRSEMRSIIGEYQTDTQLFYFVKLSDDTAFRFAAEKFKAENPELVEDYESKKASGELPPFDPSAAQIHPTARVKMVIKLNGGALISRTSQVSDAETDELVISDGKHSESENDAYSDAGESDTPLRRTTRSTAAGVHDKKQLTLPFSPKKTRSRKVVALSDSSEDEISAARVTPPRRRSTRSKKATKATLDDDETYEDQAEESDEFIQGRSTKPAKKKVVRGKASRPAYGHFRTVADLDYDEDEDTAVLRAHRDFCEKCERKPAHLLLLAAQKTQGKKRRKSRNSHEEEEEDENEEERINSLGGWVRCLKCPLAAHWGCLSKLQREEILRAALERDKTEWLRVHGDQQPLEALGGGTPSGLKPPEPVKRAGLDPYQTTEFICAQCMKGGVCMTCMEVAVKPDATHIAAAEKPETDGVATVTAKEGDAEVTDGTKEDITHPNELVFRCWTCKRLGHYAHLPLSPFADPNEEYTAADRAYYYQITTGWQCADCHSFVYAVEHILAWRPFPSTAVEPPLPPGEFPNYKTPLPREYLVKWVNRSYRRTQWVPHMWLVATHAQKLKNFLVGGSRVTLLPEPVADAAAEPMQVDEPIPEFGAAEEEMGEEGDGTSSTVITSLDPIPDAEKRIQPAWRTVDRVLDILLWSPGKRLNRLKIKKSHAKGKRKGAASRVDSEDETTQENIDREYKIAFEDGEQPSADLTETVDEWEKRNKRELTEKDIDLVVWGFFKWNGLGYDDATWDSPPHGNSSFFKSFRIGFKRFLASRKVTVKSLTRKETELFDHELPQNVFMKRFAFSPDSQPNLGQSPQLSLMPFQVDGVNWLCNNWWNRQHCILADEMGLGKTVQIVTFLGTMVRGGLKGFEQVKASPALVVVPNSTITNWVREFERWAPELRVVPFYSDAKSRDIIKNYELFHSSPAKGTTGAKYHILVTTYETIINAKEFTAVFKSTPRWEALVVDEGQRLKSDSSLIFRKLKELNTVHRIILTGTPLNNNIRELFNLMNFLDPVEWRDLEALAKEHEVLTEDSVKELHTRLRPYFLRRIKSEVLELPPKNEVIVPVSMSPLQKEIYRSILSQNLELLQTLAQTNAGPRVNAAVKKSNMNNMLMQLRKCLQHPYLVSREIEPKGLSAVEAHEKLIWASAKLRLLQTLLPKLKARGHRVLLFSQFVIALDIVEDFLTGENIKFLRLDGNTKQADRQKDMDEFNKPDSDVFIYILSTRAGGVGINLWTADTVIIFDPDFNPHQDLQAIARAHRYGQKKTCLVFKLMVKDSAEDRIIQTGKKKLVLDHLIVQKMDDDDDAEDVKSILMFGAQALFEEGADQSAREIHYSDHDIDSLIEKTETEGEQTEPQAGESMAFSFAKVWAAEKDTLEDMDDADTDAQEDAWAQTLARIAEENAKERAKEVTGRGVRRKAAAVFPQQTLDFGDTPKKDQAKARRKGKGKAKATSSDDDVYAGSPNDSGGDSSEPSSPGEFDGLGPDLAELAGGKHKKKSRYVADITRYSSPPAFTLHPPLSPILNRPNQSAAVCGLCGLAHPEAACFMTESSENLAQYRNILLTHAGDESLEDRQAAIDVIDETLYRRGKMHLIYGQPLHPVDPPSSRPEYRASGKESQPPVAQSHHRSKQTVHDPSNADNAFPMQVDSSQLVSGPSRLPVVPTQDVSAAAAGPSKRTTSPPPGVEPPKKRVKEAKAKEAKETATPPCVVCGRWPHHLLKACPAVAEGSERIERELRRLKKDPSVPASTLDSLNRLLIRQRQREQLSASAAKPPL